MFACLLDLSPVGVLGIRFFMYETVLVRIALYKVDHDDFELYGHEKDCGLVNVLKEVLLGRSSRSKIPVDFSIKGTGFQKRVWHECMSIPAGSTLTYGELAKKLGCGSPRAVGQALKANPLPIIIPCHRVVGKGGRLTGFSCGIEIKKMLLDFELEQIRRFAA